MPVKAVLLENFGGTENLRVCENVADPKPGPGEVLLRVKACALNHLDLWVRKGIPSYKIKLPHILGCDVAGQVVEKGPGAATLVGTRAAVSPGRSCRVCDRCLEGRDDLCPKYGIIGAQGGPGGYAQLLVVPEEYLLPIPDDMSYGEAAAYPLTFLTAWHMLMTLGACGPDQWVITMGAGSGVAVAAIQMAKLAGAKVIAVSTSEEKLGRAARLGADHLVLTPKQDLVKETIKATGGRMADVVVEHIGGPLFDSALKSLRQGGRLVTCGATADPELKLDLRYVFSRQYQILGSKMGTQGEMKKVARLINERRLRPVIDRDFPLDAAGAAHEHLAGQKQFGKVVLTVG